MLVYIEHQTQVGLHLHSRIIDSVSSANNLGAEFTPISQH